MGRLVTGKSGANPALSRNGDPEALPAEGKSDRRAPTRLHPLRGRGRAALPDRSTASGCPQRLFLFPQEPEEAFVITPVRPLDPVLPAPRLRTRFPTRLVTLLLAAVLVSLGSALATDYPVTLLDDLEREVTLEREPQRVIAMVPSHAELVCALGACERLVAVDDFSNYPAQVNDLPHLGSVAPAAPRQLGTCRTSAAWHLPHPGSLTRDCRVPSVNVAPLLTSSFPPPTIHFSPHPLTIPPHPPRNSALGTLSPGCNAVEPVAVFAG